MTEHIANMALQPAPLEYRPSYRIGFPPAQPSRFRYRPNWGRILVLGVGTGLAWALIGGITGIIP